MKFTFHLFVQRHENRTYTVMALPFTDITAFGIALDEIKNDLSEAITERVRAIQPQFLHQLDFDSSITLQKVVVPLRPVDRRKNLKKRREQIKMQFSLIVKPEDDGQFFITVPKVGQPPLSFYAYSKEEIPTQAVVELTNWFDDATLEHLTTFKHARSEALETLELDISLKKPKEKEDEIGGLGRDEKESFWALKETGVNMTAQAAEGRFRRTYRRTEMVEDILMTLCAPRNNSILLVGESEAGKTAILQEVVRRIHKKEVPDALLKREVWHLTPDRLIAGAQYIGTWEERVNDIANECRKKQTILYVDDLPGLLEVGRWSKSDSNIGMALKPHIASGEVIMIGEARPERLTMGMGLGASFLNLFRQITIDPMPDDEAAAVLTSVARDLERDFDVRIAPNALETAIELSRRFSPYRAFPGKAIRLLEDTLGEIKKASPSAEEGGLARRTNRPIIERGAVISTFSKRSGLPEFIVKDDARMEMSRVEGYFRERIIGQDHAVGTMVNVIATIKAGLNDPKKPLGTFLFIGPTGVGKTEMAKTLAGYLFGDTGRLIRFDMSEYGGVDGLARLIGAFSGEGELTKRVREQPFCIVLLDEFEKADPRIYDIFLQVLGEGRLTDSAGRTTFFHNALLIMTSNLGSGQRALRQVGFATDADAERGGDASDNHYRAHVEGYFRPEFVNRIDQIVTFRHLAPSALKKIASRELNAVLSRDGITRRGILVELDEGVIDLVLATGYSPIYGARPLKREIERLVVAPLARILADRSTKDQHMLRLSAEGGMIQIKPITIEEADRGEAVTISGAEGESAKQRMDTAALVEGFAVLRRKLADWEASDAVKEMRDEKTQLIAETQTPDFWRQTNDARETLSRTYFLDRLLARLTQLLERAEYLEDFSVLVNRDRALDYQPELARDYETLYQQVSYFDIEMMTAHLPHRNQAMLLIAPLATQLGGTPNGAEAWVRRLAEMYLRWAQRKGYEHDLYVMHPPTEGAGGVFQPISAGTFDDTLTSFATSPSLLEVGIMIRGTNAFGFLKGERGVHRMGGREGGGGNSEFANARVYAIPDTTKIAIWLHDYQAVLGEIAAGRRDAPPPEKYTVIRVYALDRSEVYIRDLRTGLRVRDVKAVLKGGIDPFILAYLRTEEAALTWEDRFPTTFPF
ncbi:MAG TPA: AAA family ATPase [Aggregatilineales bacterium]|nr:AAA family ATPase [Aggregatilineales bacterium]